MVNTSSIQNPKYNQHQFPKFHSKFLDSYIGPRYQILDYFLLAIIIQQLENQYCPVGDFAMQLFALHIHVNCTHKNAYPLPMPRYASGWLHGHRSCNLFKWVHENKNDTSFLFQDKVGIRWLQLFVQNYSIRPQQVQQLNEREIENRISVQRFQNISSLFGIDNIHDDTLKID